MLAFYLSILDTAEEKSLITHIYTEYKPLMMHIARSILKDEHLAEDAVHDTMLKIIEWARSHHETDPQRIKSLVCLVTKRTALNNRKYEWRRRTVNIDDLTDQPAMWDNYEHSTYSDLLSILALLPYNYQEILQLSVQHELSTKEIAKVLGLSHSNASKRLQRAKQAFGEKWRAQNADTE